MAFVQEQPQDDEEEQKKQNSQIANTDVGDTGGGISPATPASGGASTAPNQSSTPQSAGFTDVGAYLAANQPQSGQMANQVAGVLNNEYSKTQGDIDSAANAFKGQIDKSTVNPNADLVNEAASDPTKFVKDPSKLAAFNAQRTAAYGGPTQFQNDSGYSTAAQEVQNEQNRAGLANSPSQRGQLLYALGDNPTAGQVSLDSLLLGADPNAQSTIGNAANRFSGLSDYLSGKATDLNAQAATAKSNTGQAAQLVADKFTAPNTGVVPTFSSGLNQRVSTAGQLAKNYNNRVNDITGNLQTNQSLTPQEMAALNLQPGQIERLENINNISSSAYQQPAINLAQYYQGANPITAVPTAATVANSDDYSKAAALQQLMGLDAPVAGLSDPSQAGKFKIPDSFGSFYYDEANTDAVNRLTQEDKDELTMAARGPAGVGNDDLTTWLANARAAEQRVKDPNLVYNAPYQNYAGSGPTPTLGGGITNMGGDPLIDPKTGLPIVFNPNGTNSNQAGGGKAFR